MGESGEDAVAAFLSAKSVDLLFSGEQICRLFKYTAEIRRRIPFRRSGQAPTQEPQREAVVRLNHHAISILVDETEDVPTEL